MVCCGLAALCLLTGCVEKPEKKVIENPVYLCDSPFAECYHSHPDCEGLQLCGGGISEVSLEEAEVDGRRPCHYCYETR